MIKIKARGGKGVEQMLKRFKRLWDKEGLIKDTQRISYYEKPAEPAGAECGKAWLVPLAQMDSSGCNPAWRMILESVTAH